MSVSTNIDCRYEISKRIWLTEDPRNQLRCTDINWYLFRLRLSYSAIRRSCSLQQGKYCNIRGVTEAEPNLSPGANKILSLTLSLSLSLSLSPRVTLSFSQGHYIYIPHIYIYIYIYILHTHKNLSQYIYIYMCVCVCVCVCVRVWVCVCVYVFEREG